MTCGSLGSKSGNSRSAVPSRQLNKLHTYDLWTSMSVCYSSKKSLKIIMCSISEFIIFQGYHSVCLINWGGLRKWCLEFNWQKDSNQTGLEPLDDSVDSFLEGSCGWSRSELGYSLWLPIGLCPGSSSLPFCCWIQQKKSGSHRPLRRLQTAKSFPPVSNPSPSRHIWPHITGQTQGRHSFLKRWITVRAVRLLGGSRQSLRSCNKVWNLK